VSKEQPKKKSKPTQLLPENCAPKATKEEQETRARETLELIIQGKFGHVLLQDVAKRYGVSERTAHDIIARARISLVESTRQTAEEVAATLKTRYWNIANQTEAAKEFSTSITALKEIGKLAGLDQQIVNHVVHTKELDEIPIDAIDAELIGKKDE
jgi:ribosomal protein S13